MNRRKLAVIAVLALLVGAYFALDLQRFLDVDHFTQQRDAIESFRQARPLLSSAIYFVAYVAVAALSIPGAAAMTLVGGALFGLLQGTLLVSFASAIGATLAFLASRFVLRDSVQRRFGDRLGAIDEGIRKEGGFYLFTLRLVPIFPFFVINLVMGLTPLRTLTFYWVSQLGMFAGTLVYVNAGTRLGQLESIGEVFSAGVLASFALLGIFPLIAKRIVDRVRARKVYAGWPRPRRFDRNLVVIGAGSAGLVAAYIAAALRARVTLVEKHRMGGDCLNTGCVPSKALLRSAKLLSQIRRSREFGIRAGDVEIDFAELMDRVRSVVRAIEPHDSAARYTDLGVEVLAGEAKIVSPWEVEIRGEAGEVRRLSTRSIVIAAGARPLVPTIPGIEETGYLTSDTVWELRERPRRLLVLGGGPIGCELAQAFARLGSVVTLLESAPRLMLREDPEVSTIVAEHLRADGIELRIGHRATRCESEHGRKHLVAEADGKELRMPFDALLVAIGRIANVQGYGLEELGITGGKTLETNGFLQTRFPNIYAAGDVVGPYQFTHTAAHQAWYAAVNALFDPLKTFRADYSAVPWATFVDPEVARVGLNEQDAQKSGIAYEVTRYGLDELDRAIVDGVARGFIKVLTVPGKDRILGVTIVGEHAAELLPEYVLAMRLGIGLNKILGTIHIYPTFAEANKYVAGTWKRAHAPERVLRWLARFHASRRGDGGRAGSGNRIAAQSPAAPGTQKR